MGNDLFGFSPEAFEQFVRALAIIVFGPGVKAFGNGPDGGREAIFRGEVPYPYPPTQHWNGYGVIQAKCKEKAETTQRDQKWALDLLEKELEAFVKSKKRDPKPEYYVFVTNVELSAGGAGWDAGEKIIQSYYSRLPLKGHAIWDANQLNAYLTRFEELRKRFTAHLTPGDVLAELLADIQKRRSDVTHILTAYLDRELRADESARLDQAGNRTDDQLRLAHLFFDLPASAQQQLEPPDDKRNRDGRLPPGVLKELLIAGGRKLDPLTLYEQEGGPEESHQERFPTRFVLLGGPGSGKSTLGQFLAQIHRAALLSRRPPHSLEVQTRDAIRDTRALCESDGLIWPSTPRYPVRVDLNRFAKAMASKGPDHVCSLEAYILNEIKREHPLSHTEFLDWLRVHPWLLILDGLDEVPVTSNREVVVRAVNDFLAEARQVGADLFIVATSRQQGYGGEFAGGVVAFRHVMPLSKDRALLYVERYAQARFGTAQKTRAKELVEKIKASAESELTAQLLSTPLQVTFMATVVAASGTPAEERWQLFAGYYQTIYERERQKAVPPYDSVLSKQKPLIDRLHHDIGFLLQYEGETTSGRAASMSIDKFRHLVKSYLEEQGREGAEKEKLATLITEAAHSRLIFLTNRVEGELSFDVRSLQEFMAAECLMVADPERPAVIRERLRAIAPFPYWRNVFLFAAGKCFGDSHSRYLQDVIRGICEDANDASDRLLSATRAGSDIALDILQSGAVTENHTYARRLAQIALELVTHRYLVNEPVESAPADRRLALVHRRPLTEVYREEIELRVGQVDQRRTLGVWPLLLRLVESGIDWAEDLANRSWPADSSNALYLVQRLIVHVETPWLLNRISKLIPELAPASVWGLIRDFDSPVELPNLFSSVKHLVPEPREQKGVAILKDEVAGDAFAFFFRQYSISDPDDQKAFTALAQMPEGHNAWIPYKQATRFFGDPTQKDLADALRACASRGVGRDLTFNYGLGTILPWPLTACLQWAKTPEELADLAVAVENGELGTPDDWKAAETRWEIAGITKKDLIASSSTLKPFDATIREVGFPSSLPVLCRVVHRDYSEVVINELRTTTKELPSGERKHDLAWFLLVASAKSKAFVNVVDPVELKEILEDCTKLKVYRLPEEVPNEPDRVGQWTDLVEWLGTNDRLGIVIRWSESENNWIPIFQGGFTYNSKRAGLLRILCRFAADGASLNAIPSHLIDHTKMSDLASKFSAIVVRLSQADLAAAEATQLADVASPLLYPPAIANADALLFSTIEHSLDINPEVQYFLLRLHEKMSADIDLGFARCERLLRKSLRGRRSDLQKPERLVELGLPTMPQPVA